MVCPLARAWCAHGAGNGDGDRVGEQGEAGGSGGGGGVRVGEGGECGQGTFQWPVVECRSNIIPSDQHVNLLAYGGNLNRSDQLLTWTSSSLPLPLAPPPCPSPLTLPLAPQPCPSPLPLPLASPVAPPPCPSPMPLPVAPPLAPPLPSPCLSPLPLPHAPPPCPSPCPSRCPSRCPFPCPSPCPSPTGEDQICSLHPLAAPPLLERTSSALFIRLPPVHPAKAALGFTLRTPLQRTAAFSGGGIPSLKELKGNWQQSKHQSAKRELWAGRWAGAIAWKRVVKIRDSPVTPNRPRDVLLRIHSLNLQVGERLSFLSGKPVCPHCGEFETLEHCRWVQWPMGAVADGCSGRRVRWVLAGFMVWPMGATAVVPVVGAMGGDGCGGSDGGDMVLMPLMLDDGERTRQQTPLSPIRPVGSAICTLLAFVCVCSAFVVRTMRIDGSQLLHTWQLFGWTINTAIPTASIVRVDLCKMEWAISNKYFCEVAAADGKQLDFSGHLSKEECVWLQHEVSSFLLSLPAESV
ncbi:unnamed protein product [Closterium sp. NIES-65]|nr:unnamed protein product [Closterium sp. NIES-65]